MRVAVCRSEVLGSLCRMSGQNATRAAEVSVQCLQWWKKFCNAEKVTTLSQFSKSLVKIMILNPKNYLRNVQYTQNISL